MRIPILISILSLVFAVSLNAQENSHKHSNNPSIWENEPASADRIFTFSYGTHEKDTTFELIDCPTENDAHQRIDIHWENGIPRYGIITDCSKQKHNVSYFPAGFNPPKGAAKSISINPKVMSNRAELYSKYPVAIIIMDVLTGNIVHESLETPVNSETYTHRSDTTFAHTEPGKTEPSGFFKLRAADMPTKNTKPNIINYSHLDNGLYFAVFIDSNSKEIVFFKTFRKGIK